MAVLGFSNVIILGFIAGNVSVGIYSAAEKVIRAAANLLSPVINAIYPHVSKLVHENYKQGMIFIEKVEKWEKKSFSLILLMIIIVNTFS